jgi:hypothetical protein
MHPALLVVALFERVLGDGQGIDEAFEGGRRSAYAGPALLDLQVGLPGGQASGNQCQAARRGKGRDLGRRKLLLSQCRAC